MVPHRRGVLTTLPPQVPHVRTLSSLQVPYVRDNVQCPRGGTASISSRDSVADRYKPRDQHDEPFDLFLDTPSGGALYLRTVVHASAY